MKFIITKSIFENIISSMQSFLEKKDASEITSHIYLEINDSNLIIKASDYEIGLESTTNNINNTDNGKATANGANLLGIIKRLKNDDITIQTEKNHLIINQNKSKFKLPMYDPLEFPNSIKKEKLLKLDISTFNLINSIKKITPSIDNNNAKFELNGALIDIKESKINFASTDTRRLAVSYLENIKNEIGQIIIPKKAIIEIQKLFLDDANIEYNDNNLIISNETNKFFTKLINGKYPDYERIIPKNLNNKILVPKNLFIESIKLVTSIFSNIKISFSSSNIIFESLDEESESKTQIDINLDIKDEFFFAVNARYLLDFLSQANNENILVGFNDSNLPFYLEDEKFFTVVMPIILEK